MSACGLRGKAKTTVCVTCGGKNNTHKPTCSYCQMDEKLASRRKKQCANCGLEIPDSRRMDTSYCSHKCSNEVVHIALKAGAKVHAAIRRGSIPKLDGTIGCVDCGRTARHYDHRDYTKPLDVVPVCISCNFKRGTANVIRHHEQVAA